METVVTCNNKMKRKLRRHIHLVFSAVSLLLASMIVFLIPPFNIPLIIFFHALLTLGAFFLMKALGLPRFVLPLSVFVGLTLALQSFGLLTPFHLVLLVASLMGIMILIR